MVEKINSAAQGLLIPQDLPVQPIEEDKKRTDYSWFNSTLSSTTTSQAYAATPDQVNDIIFGKSPLSQEVLLNGEKQAEARGQKMIPLVKSNKDIGQKEHQLEKDQLQALEEYINNRIEQIFNTSTHFKSKRVQEKYIREQILDLQKELNEHQKKSTILKWIDRIFTGGLVLAGIGSLILTIATSGAALPTILVFANATFAFGSGATKIISAVNQHKSDKRTGELIELGENRQILNNLSSEDIEELREVNDKEMEAHKQKKKEQERKEETSKNIHNNRGG